MNILSQMKTVFLLKILNIMNKMAPSDMGLPRMGLKAAIKASLVFATLQPFPPRYRDAAGAERRSYLYLDFPLRFPRLL